jgi:hypothetical protein
VFNVEQCEGLDLPKLETRKVDVIAEAEAIVAAMLTRQASLMTAAPELSTVHN